MLHASAILYTVVKRLRSTKSVAWQEKFSVVVQLFVVKKRGVLARYLSSDGCCTKFNIYYFILCLF